jgi:hypothetical protein
MLSVNRGGSIYFIIRSCLAASSSNDRKADELDGCIGWDVAKNSSKAQGLPRYLTKVPGTITTIGPIDFVSENTRKNSRPPSPTLESYIFCGNATIFCHVHVESSVYLEC